MSAAKNLKSNMAAKLAELKAKKAKEAAVVAPKKAKVIELAKKKGVSDIAKALKAKPAAKSVSVIGDSKERAKMERLGVEVLKVAGPQGPEFQVVIGGDADAFSVTVDSAEYALTAGAHLYMHIKEQATKLAKQMAED